MSPLADQLEKVPPAVRPNVQAAIRTVREVAPGAEEIPYRTAAPRSNRMMWKLVRYAIDGEEVVGIGTFAEHSTLYFYRGRELDDGNGLLQGGGKEMRFITLLSPADAGRAEVKQMVRKAFRLARS
jgi:hypothetical protein